ncbi:MAG: PAS domain-containing protein, partial [Anaerolineaceae bacterium]|nr:PAS domain-containing protein [Anaerolineaceae bacterium]
VISWDEIDGLIAIINQELGLQPDGLNSDEQVFEALRESEEWYQTILEHIHDGITILKHGKVEYVSERALEIFGCTRESYEQYFVFDFTAKRIPGSLLRGFHV